MRKARQIGLVWPDMNKFQSQKVIGSGGVVTILSFIIGLFLFIALVVFSSNPMQEHLVEIISLTSVVLMLAGIGLIDDLFGWQRGGLSKRSRILLVLIAAIPLIAINAGRSTISLPFFGIVDLGLLYPFLFVPLGMVGAATTFNFLAGFNGLEAGQGILLLLGAAFVAYTTGSVWLAIPALIMVAALLAFLLFNFYPARVFPGDSLTYSVGGLFAALCILGNFERIALFFFIPVILEVVLKARGGLSKHSFGHPQKDGSLTLRYDKLYGCTHLALYLLQRFGYKATERKAVFLIWTFQLLIIILGLLLFMPGTLI